MPLGIKGVAAIKTGSGRFSKRTKFYPVQILVCRAFEGGIIENRMLFLIAATSWLSIFYPEAIYEDAAARNYAV